MNDERDSFGCLRLAIPVAIALFSLVGYLRNSQVNPVTGEKQHVANLTPEAEISLGLQAAPSMAQQYGGYSTDAEATARVERMGAALVQRSEAGRGPYPFKFHLLADDRTINAFALPGGQVFITQALLSKLQTDGQLATVLGHEMGHVIDRHSSQQLAKQKLTQGLSSAAVIGAYSSRRGYGAGMASEAVAALFSQLTNLKFSREDELKADRFGVIFSEEAGYDPRAMIGVMKILEEAAPGARAEYFQTHPNPEHRIERIESDIRGAFPKGLPQGLAP